jgi:hypothetical protein
MRQLLVGGYRPALNLSFLNGVIDGRMTVSGGANGTVVNNAGLVVAASCPRFDYDPVTLAAKGLLVEEARTNLLLRSAEFDNASWTKFQATATADQTTSPGGTTTGDLLKEDGSAGTHVVFQNATTSAATSNTLTVYAKSKERTRIRLLMSDTGANDVRADFDLSAQTTSNVTADGTGSSPVADITAAGSGWYRCRLTGIPAGAGATVRSHVYLLDASGNLSYTGDNASGLYVWGAQLEAATFATSYIPTTTATVTRTADSVTMTGSNFSSWFNAAQGTLYAEFDFNVTNSVAPSTAASITDGTATNAFEARTSTGHTLYAATASVGGAALTGLDNATVGATSAGAVLKAALAYSSGNSNIAGGGAIGAGSTTTFAAGSFTTLTLGNSPIASRALNGHLRACRYYPTRLPNSTLQAMTA